MPLEDVTARFEQLKRQITSERKKAEVLKAEANAIEAQTNAQFARIEQGLPEPDTCPDCWVRLGVINPMIATRAADPIHFDRWECRARCGYYFDIST